MKRWDTGMGFDVHPGHMPRHTKQPENRQRGLMTIEQIIHRTGRERPISKPIESWNPPDTAELTKLTSELTYIGRRIHSLRMAVLYNAEEENWRIRRAMANRKNAVEKAFRKGVKAGRKNRRAKRRYLLP